MPATAIAVQAYGTDPTGRGISPMTRDLMEILKRLLTVDYPDAVIILQGGYRFNGGPTESELMEQYVRQMGFSNEILLDLESMNTITGMEAIRTLSDQIGADSVIVLCQKCHAKRVRYTLDKVFKGSRTEHFVLDKETPFGGNSQPRLNSGWHLSLRPQNIGWYPWEYLLARPRTWLHFHGWPVK